MLRALLYFEAAWDEKPVLIEWVRAYFALVFLRYMNLLEITTLPEINTMMAAAISCIVQ